MVWPTANWQLFPGTGSKVEPFYKSTEVHNTVSSIRTVNQRYHGCFRPLHTHAEVLFVGRWKGSMNHDARIILLTILNLSFPVTIC